MTAPLRRCACGGEAHVTFMGAYPHMRRAGCFACPASTAYHPTEAAAIAEWQGGAGEQQEQIKVLLGALIGVMKVYYDTPATYEDCYYAFCKSAEPWNTAAKAINLVLPLPAPPTTGAGT